MNARLDSLELCAGRAIDWLERFEKNEVKRTVDDLGVIGLESKWVSKSFLLDLLGRGSTKCHGIL